MTAETCNLNRTCKDIPKSDNGYRVVVAEVQLFISKQQRVSNEDKDGSQDEGHKHLDVDVIPGTVQLPGEHSQFKSGHLCCVIHLCYTNMFTVEEKETKNPHLIRQKMAMATVRARRDSAYPMVYIVLT